MSDDLRDQFDSFIEASGKLSRLAIFRDKKREWASTDARRCGNCNDWMKSRECPREKNVNGYSKGPSCNDHACDQFTLKPWVAELKDKRWAVIEKEAQELGLT